MNKVCLLIVLFLVLGAQLFAAGKQEEIEPTTQNDEWILCITDFDVSSMPQERAHIAPVIMRMITERLSVISYRTRISPEYAYYEEFAWTRERSNAAKALSAKQEERSRLIFRGDSGWRYRQNIARIDEDIERLRAVLEEVENNVPLINKEPVFNLTAANLNFTFPAAPRAGMELRFCNEQRADAFLSGSIREFHGRNVLSVKLYTVFTRSFVWEDSVVFSHDDLENAIDEIARRLVIVLSGNESALVAINVEPEDTMVLINRTFAGRGEITPMEHPPGMVLITASAPNYESVTFETELFGGELAEINIRLQAIEYGNLEIFENTPGSVYLGSLYMGEAPLMLRLPVNQMEYIVLEASDTERAALAFHTPVVPDFSLSLPLRVETPFQSGRVDRERRHFYWTWGGTWITGLATWISYYTFLNADMALRSGFVTEDPVFYDNYQTMYYVTMGTAVALGTVTVYGIYRLIRYIYIANRTATPIAETDGN